jgi:hypothetical protein
MALLYGYGTGSNVESFRYDQVADLLNQIPNNTTNLVKAKDVRDSVFSLWERINDLSVIVASASAIPTTFMNPDPTTITVGGVTQGTTFPTPQTVQQMFNAILYPYTAPRISLSVVGSFGSTIPINTQKEYGQSLSPNWLYWSVTKRSNPIVSIIINSTIGGTTYNSVTISPITGNTQTGWRSVSGTYSSSLGSFPVSTSNIFTLVVNDGTSTIATTATITWMNKIYWGRIDLSGLTFPNPNLTLNPSYATFVTSAITSTLIRNLATGVSAGAGVGTGSELSITKNKTYNQINGNGRYLIFAWPSSVSGATTPTFTVNGLPNTAFTRVNTAWPFTNQFNVTTNYEVWVSNTAYNSAANIIVS